MRDIHAVIDRIVEVSPEPERTELRLQLNPVKDTAMYCAPECMPQVWGRMCRILQEELGVPDTDWKKAIERIVQGVE